ncbi:AfsR/SARP family transcriptional regulator [Actinophytocola sp.]|uniref:AfsR/SARP family transcriptional regulator n=1 Tax=Actinophytocola sp. TaxID=1872138 RepID=UPI002ED3953F
MAQRSVRIQLLGGLRAWRGGGEIDVGPPARRAVLGLLALAGGETVTTRELVDSLWGDRPPRSAVNVLQTHVKHLRKVLEPDRPRRTGSDALPHIGGGYALKQVDVDLARVRCLVAEARHRDSARAAELLREALRLWPGQPLADIPFLASHPKVVALVAERRDVLARYADTMIAIGAAAEALPDIAEAAAEQPLDEPVQARLIRAYHAVGQRAKAFQLYQEVRDRLVDELGVDPGPELRAAHAALLQNENTPVRRRPKQLPAEPFGFTGRHAELSIMDDWLTRRAVAAVLSGATGVGKSALAVYWAHRVRQRFPDGQLYADLRGQVRSIDVLTRFLTALGVPAEQVPADQVAAAALYRTLLAGRKMLVLLDNVTGPHQVRPLLPGAPGCFVVVTGHDRMSGLNARQLTLDALGRDDALQLVANVLGPELHDHLVQWMSSRAE